MINKRFKKTICITALITALSFPNIKYVEKGITYLSNKEKLDEADNIKDIIINTYNNNEISKLNNIYAAFGYFSALIHSGCININDEYSPNEDAKFHDYFGNFGYDVFTNEIVCRHENFLISELLNLAGFDAMPIGAKPISEGQNHVYVLLFDHNSKAIGDSYNSCFWRIYNIDETEAIKCEISDGKIYLMNSGCKINPDLLDSLFSNPKFQLSDLVKFIDYDNDENFNNIYLYYYMGISSFKEADKNEIKNKISNSKNKLKELEK